MALQDHSIKFWDRYDHSEKLEAVYGESAVQFLYSNPLGKAINRFLIGTSTPSQIVGDYYSSTASVDRIEPFVKKFKIDLKEFVEEEYKSFNDFFVRQFRPGQREFGNSPSFPAFAEARYFVFEDIQLNSEFPVKELSLNPTQLLGDKDEASRYEGGVAFVARLCPVDYHRFHYPVEGEIVRHYRLPGELHSVNPVALGFSREILCKNERHVSILQTQKFGRLAYVEIGALCVGKILQTHTAKNFTRGQEKGMFKFGASTVVLFVEKHKLTPSDDLIRESGRRREVYIKLGDSLGNELEQPTPI